MPPRDAPKTAGILCVGTELTRGEIVNTNATWLAERLTLIGLEVAAVDATSDHRDRITGALRRLAADHGLVVCTGGLGPTSDDITSECVAALLGVPLERNEASLAAIRSRMERFGRTMSETNAKQADFPAGVRVLPNPVGTAPGFSVRIGEALAMFLPGVPHEMKRMFDDHVAPEARPLAGAAIRQVRLRTFGLPESVVAEKLAGVEERYPVTLAYRAHFPEIEVKVHATDAAAAGAAAREIRALLGERVVFGEAGDTLAASTLSLLDEKDWTLAVAESLTGGRLTGLMTDGSPNARFLGGVTLCDEASLSGRFGPGSEILLRHGAHSPEAAVALAKTARREFGAQVGLAVTGANDEGGPDVPPGLMTAAAVTPGRTVTRSRTHPASAEFVRTLAAFFAVGLLRTVLLGEADEP